MLRTWLFVGINHNDDIIYNRWIEVLGTATSVSEEFDSTPNDFGQNGAGEALEEEYTAY